MITPNKFVSFEKSILNKLDVLMKLDIKDIEIIELYRRTSKNFDNIDQFIITIDVLYVLGCIDIDFDNRILSYVNRNTLRNI